MSCPERTDRADYKGGRAERGKQKTPTILASSTSTTSAGRLPLRNLHAAVFAKLHGTGKLGLLQPARFPQSARNALTECRCGRSTPISASSRRRAAGAGHPLPSTDTCRDWQRAAIEAGGGWKGDTVTEDLRTSPTAAGKGWRACFDQRRVARRAAGDAADLADASRQRWQDGFRHVSLPHGPAILKSPRHHASAKAAALLHSACR